MAVCYSSIQAPQVEKESGAEGEEEMEILRDGYIAMSNIQKENDPEGE